MSTILFLTGVVVGVYFILYHTVIKGARCKSETKLHGKTVIVTGSNTGIGKATALELARRGARVILACRNKEKAEAAVSDIRRESGNSEVLYMKLDLASQKSVRSFAEAFLKTEPRLDLLINNAGIFLNGRTEEGLGMMFGVNHLGHFLLTNLLLERLKEGSPSRIVNVSSMAHQWGDIDFDCLNTHKELGLGDSFFSMIKTYSHSKLCNVLFTHELAKRLQETSVTCFSLHPGAINSDLTRNTNILWIILMKPITTLFFRDVESGSQTTLHCALQEGLERYSGRYFSDCAVRKVSAKAQDDAVARKLWEVSETLCGLS